MPLPLRFAWLAVPLVAGCHGRDLRAHEITVRTARTDVNVDECAANPTTVYVRDHAHLLAVSQDTGSTTIVPTGGSPIDTIAATDDGVAWVGGSILWWWPRATDGPASQLATDVAPGSLAADARQVCWAHVAQNVNDEVADFVTCASGAGLTERTQASISTTKYQGKSDHRGALVMVADRGSSRTNVLELPSTRQTAVPDAVDDIVVNPVGGYIIRTLERHLMQTGLPDRPITAPSALEQLTVANAVVYARGVDDAVVFELESEQHLMRAVDTDRSLRTTALCSDGTHLFAGTSGHELVELVRK